MTNQYTVEDIQVLKGLEAVRKRPGMYIGDTGSDGLHQLVWEILDNSVDEALNGHCDFIDVVLLAEGSVSVEDFVVGCPWKSIQAQAKIPWKPYFAICTRAESSTTMFTKWRAVFTEWEPLW